jgi:hypothetical protein
MIKYVNRSLSFERSSTRITCVELGNGSDIDDPKMERSKRMLAPALDPTRSLVHSFRRANITWRQEVGGGSIETSEIAGRASTRITGEYTVVQLKS